MDDFLTFWDDLTLREKEIFCFIVEGLTDKEIAEELYLHLRTVKTHVHHILKKFGKRSRVSLVVYYYRDSGYLKLSKQQKGGMMDDFLTCWDKLTPREKEIFCFIVEGLTNKEIAEELYLSVKTVGLHIHRILKKFGKRSRVSLGAYYYRDSGYLIIKEGVNYGIHKAA